MIGSTPMTSAAFGTMPSFLHFAEILAEAMERLRRERHRVLAENEKAIMADVRHAGLRILGDDDAGRDVGAAVLRAVLRHRKIADVDGVAFDDLFVARRAVAAKIGGIGLSRPCSTLSKIVSSSASKASSALLRVE